MSRRILLAAVAAAQLLAAAPARAQDQQQQSWFVAARAGAQQAARPVAAPSPAPDLGVGPGLEAALSRRLLPWLEVELAAGWNRSEAPQQHDLVSGDPMDPLAPLVLLTVTQRLTTASLVASARARWPAPWAVRPYLVAGGGALHADLLTSTNVSALYPTRNATGWAPVFQAGGGLDLQPWSGLLVGVEARWRWGHATLHEHVDPTYALFATSRSGDANLGGFSLQVSAGWEF